MFSLACLRNSLSTGYYWFLHFIFHFCGAAFVFSGFRESSQDSWFSLCLRGKGMLKSATFLPPYGKLFFFHESMAEKESEYRKTCFLSLQSSPSPQISIRTWLKPKHLLTRYKGRVSSWWSQLEVYRAIGKDADLVHTIFCLILQLYGITYQSGCCVKGMAFMRRLCSIFVVNQQLVWAATR